MSACEAEISAMDKVKQAALARAQVQAAQPVVDHGVVKEAVKAFNAVVHQVPDYMHIHCSQILDALQTLDKVLKDLIALDGKSPKDPSKQLSIKAKVYRKKTHELDAAYKAVVLLGFKEEVVDLEKSLVYHGRFSSPAESKTYLVQCSERLQTTLRDVQRHAQAAVNNKDNKQAAEQRLRAAALAQYQEDRARQKQRTERERQLRQEAAAARERQLREEAAAARERQLREEAAAAAAAAAAGVPEGGGSGDDDMAAPVGGAVATGGAVGVGAQHAGGMLGQAHESPGAVEAGSREEGGAGGDAQEDENDDESEDRSMEDIRGAAIAPGLRQRFPGQENRLGGGDV